MRPDGAQTIHAVRTFLEEVVLPGVEQQHRSETRAALKLLDSAACELDALAGVLVDEIHALGVLCRRADELLGTSFEGADDPAAADHGLQRLHAEHDRSRAAATEAVTALQARLRADGVAADGDGRVLLRDFLRTLGDHATTRLPWQSVFARPSISEELLDVQHRQ